MLLKALLHCCTKFCAHRAFGTNTSSYLTGGVWMDGLGFL